MYIAVRIYCYYNKIKVINVKVVHLSYLLNAPAGRSITLETLYIIAGLGNPGIKYRHTRHNAGFLVVDILAEKYNINVNQIKHKALVGTGKIEDKKVILVKPQTYMNNSGESIKDIVEWYKLPLEQLIVIYDDLDLPLGKLRVRAKGSSGTHNGMKSVIYHLQSEIFPRIRVGIDKAPDGWDTIDYVLGKFTESEKKIVYDGLIRAADAAATIVTSGVNEAMNKFNG